MPCGRSNDYLQRLLIRPARDARCGSSTRGLGPTAVARHLLRHHETSFQNCLVSAFVSRPKAEAKLLRRLCRLLLKYASSPVISTQLKALEEIMDLAIKDPDIRRLPAESRLGHLTPKYRELDVIISTSKAVSVRDVQTHHLWPDFILGGRFAWMDGVLPMPSNLTKSFKDFLRYDSCRENTCIYERNLNLKIGRAHV